MLTGQVVQVPLSSITSIMKEAQDAGLRANWEKIFQNWKRTSDRMILKDGNKLNAFNGTFGEEDGKGNMDFTLLSTGEKKVIPVDKMHGLYFLRQADPTSSVVCRLLDRGTNIIVVSSITKDEKGLTVKTPAGASIAVGREMLTRLDYSRG
jgi:hypothetical protein